MSQITIIALVGSSYSHAIIDAQNILQTDGYTPLPVQTNLPENSPEYDADGKELSKFHSINSFETVMQYLKHMPTSEMDEDSAAVCIRNNQRYTIPKKYISGHYHYVLVADPYLVMQLKDSQQYNVKAVYFEYAESDIFSEMANALKEAYGLKPLPTKLMSEFLDTLIEDRTRLDKNFASPSSPYTDYRVSYDEQKFGISDAFIGKITDIGKKEFQIA